MPKRTTTSLEVGGRELTLSNQDKVLFPKDGYTKGDLVRYYASVGKWLVPHLEDRPLTLQRYPEGIEGPSFFEKQKPRFTPDWIPTVTLDAAFSHGKSKRIDYILCNDDATLIWCANLASIVFHIWYSRVETLDFPDFALFDLDPFGATVKTLATVALQLREVLAEIGMQALVKTSGGTGLHVVVPLKPQYDYETIKQFAQIVAHRVAAACPDDTTLERTIARRKEGTVYLDYVQVGKGKTVVPPFVVRARDGAPVSMPLDWSEIEAWSRKRGGDPERVFAQWTMKNALGRLKREGDLWAGKAWKEARLEPALKKAQRVWA